MTNLCYVSSKYFRLLLVCGLVFVLCQSLVCSQGFMPTMLDERGDTVNYSFPPPDSAYVPNEIIIYFKASALRLDSLCWFFIKVCG